MAIDEARQPVDTEGFYGSLAPFNVGPLWTAQLLRPEPAGRAAPYVWRYDEIRELLLQAGEVVDAEEAERRVLMLMNPGLDGRASATPTLYAGLQLVLPGEIAPAHRHSAAALRFIVEGSGAYTTVDGERQVMQPGDLVLTPNWAWHDHGNDTGEPMIWLDGLDIPLVNALDVGFFERSSTKAQSLTKPDNASKHMFASGRLNPVWERWQKPYSPLFNYPWAQTKRILDEVAGDTEGSPTDGIILEYTNPYTGGPALPTLGCFVQALPPGAHTDAHQHTTSAVYHVVRGNGSSIVGGERLEWQERDTFAVPGWAVHEHENGAADEPAILFSFTDAPIVEALGYFREESADRQA